MTTAIRWLIGLFSSLMFPLIAAALGWDDPWLVIVASALFGALCLWNVNAEYKKWINDVDRGWTASYWLKVNLALAALGATSVAAGTLVMSWASTENLQIAIAYALGMYLGGMVPVVQVVRAKLATVAKAFPEPVAWILNGLLIAATTVVPGGLITGWERSGLTFGGIAGVVWLLFELSARFWGRNPLILAAGAFLMLLPIAFVLFADADRISWQLLLLFPAGLALVSARRRTDGESMMSPRAIGGAKSWTVTALAASILLVVGATWWKIAIGDDVSTTLLYAGAAGAIAFGASLVTRGEGLIIVLLIGLLMMWVVQDHTGDPAPLAALDSPAVLAAFGDSYLSGEGIGSFYAGTNTAGRDDLRIEGINECRRSEYAFSPLVAVDRGLDLAFYGCSGALATTAGFAAREPQEADDFEFERNTVYGQLLRWEQERGTDNDPELILLSLGGNDAGFAKIGAACFLPGSCDNALDASATPALEGVTARVEDALTKARELFPTSPMVVVAYPQMFGPDADQCGGQVPFNGTETNALRNFVDALNRAVGAAVASVGGGQVVHFTGATRAYDGERFCELDASGSLVEPTAIRSLAFQPTDGDDLVDRLGPAKIIHNTFHPTRRGHELVTAKLLEFLDEGCHLGTVSELCTSATAADAAPVVVEPSGVVAVEESSGVDEMGSEEVVEDAPIGGCNDLSSFNQCTIIQSLRLVLVPFVLLVIGGVLLMVSVRQGDLVDWVQRRLPLGRFAIQITPLRDVE